MICIQNLGLVYIIIIEPCYCLCGCFYCAHEWFFCFVAENSSVCLCFFIVIIIFVSIFNGFFSHSGKACSNGIHLWTKLPCGQTWRQLPHPTYTPLLRRLPTSTPAHPFVYFLLPSNPTPDALPGHQADPLVGQSTDSNNVEMKRIAFLCILSRLLCSKLVNLPT